MSKTHATSGIKIPSSDLWGEQRSFTYKTAQPGKKGSGRDIGWGQKAEQRIAERQRDISSRTVDYATQTLGVWVRKSHVQNMRQTHDPEREQAVNSNVWGPPPKEEPRISTMGGVKRVAFSSIAEDFRRKIAEARKTRREKLEARKRGACPEEYAALKSTKQTWGQKMTVK